MYVNSWRTHQQVVVKDYLVRVIEKSEASFIGSMNAFPVLHDSIDADVFDLFIQRLSNLGRQGHFVKGLLKQNNIFFNYSPV